jgi:hypothetical protein
VVHETHRAVDDEAGGCLDRDVRGDRSHLLADAQAVGVGLEKGRLSAANVVSESAPQ